MSAAAFAKNNLTIELQSDYRITHLSYALLKILQDDVSQLPYFTDSTALLGSWGHQVYKDILSDITKVQNSNVLNIFLFRSYTFARNVLEHSLCDLVAAMSLKKGKDLLNVIYRFHEKLDNLCSEQPQNAPYLFQALPDGTKIMKETLRREKREYLVKCLQIIIIRTQNLSDNSLDKLLDPLKDLVETLEGDNEKQIQDSTVNIVVSVLIEINWHSSTGSLTDKEISIITAAIDEMKPKENVTTLPGGTTTEPSDDDMKVMANILKLVAKVGIQYAEQMTTLANICLLFYGSRSHRKEATKASEFSSLASLTSIAITEAKDKLTKLMDDEDNTHPVQKAMKSAIDALRMHADNYDISEDIEKKLHDARDKDEKRLKHCREQIKDRISGFGV